MPSNSGTVNGNKIMLVLPTICFASGNTIDAAISKAMNSTSYSPFIEYIAFTRGWVIDLGCPYVESYQNLGLP